jgi:hypothetical protein
MQVYGNVEVVPVYYTTFTLASVVGGAVVYNEFDGISRLRTLLFVLGMCCSLGGVSAVVSGRATPLVEFEAPPLYEEDDEQALMAGGAADEAPAVADNVDNVADVATGCSAADEVVTVADDAVGSAAEGKKGGAADGTTGGSAADGKEGSAAHGEKGVMDGTDGGAEVGKEARNDAATADRADSGGAGGAHGLDEESISSPGSVFLFLEPQQKVEALKHQPPAAKLFGGGVGATLLQALVDTEIEFDRESAIRTSEEANYPSSLHAAQRIIQNRPLPLPSRVAPVLARPPARGTRSPKRAVVPYERTAPVRPAASGVPGRSTTTSSDAPPLAVVNLEEGVAGGVAREL